MAHRIDHVEKFTTTNSDALAGGALDPMPGNGYLRIYACSIVDTCTISIQPARHPNPTGSGAGHVIERATTPEIRAYDPHYETEVQAGEKVVIQFGGTTSEVLLWASFIGG
jgi:hypothetical protein